MNGGYSFLVLHQVLFYLVRSLLCILAVASLAVASLAVALLAAVPALEALSAAVPPAEEEKVSYKLPSQAYTAEQ